MPPSPAPDLGPGSVERTGPPRLRERYGDLALPWVRLGRGTPTPVEALPGLTDAAEVWVKRDDLTGERYGGNKVRKLELLLADALARGRRRVVTFGAYGSHHALATAIYGRMLGLEVHLALHPQPLSDHALDDLLYDQAAGARLVRVSQPALPLAVAVHMAFAQPGEVIPPGGSTPLGSVGYVEAGLELAAQVAHGELPAPDLIFVAAGTCGTVAGLQLGLELAGLVTRVVAVRVVPPIITNLYVIRRLRALCLRLLRRACPRVPRPEARVEVALDGEELGLGYGEVTAASREAVRRLGEAGLTLETTYTGKAAAALLRWAEQGPGRGQRLLFWHTFSSVDPGAWLPRVDPASLPAAFHPALAEGGRL